MSSRAIRPLPSEKGWMHKKSSTNAAIKNGAGKCPVSMARLQSTSGLIRNIPPIMTVMTKSMDACLPDCSGSRTWFLDL